MSDLVFNILDIFAEDYGDGRDRTYLVKLFGRDADGRTVSVNLLDYTPHFYVKLPRQLNSSEVNATRAFMTATYGDSNFCGLSVVQKKDFWGFTNDATFPFLQLKFRNHDTMKRASKMFDKKVTIGNLKGVQLRQYESNIEPFLRMFHKR